MQLPVRVFVVMTHNKDGSDPDEIDETWTHIRRLLMFLQMLHCPNFQVKNERGFVEKFTVFDGERRLLEKTQMTQKDDSNLSNVNTAKVSQLYS